MMIEEIVIGTLAFFLALIIVAFIVFIVQFNKRLELVRNEHKITMDTAIKKLQEQTLKNLSADILDSFGNNLFVIKLKMKLLEEVAESLKKMEIRNLQESASIIETSVMETKKTLEHMAVDMINTCVRLTKDVADNSFLKNLENELKRLDGYTPEVFGDEYPLGKEKEFILLYICQQALDNVIQHSRTQKINIFIYYTLTSFSLRLEDDGIGFPQKDLPALKKSGKGFQNMSNAAELINANLSIKSKPHEGTTISIDLETLAN